jgi:FeS assembly SUF system protein
MAHFGIGYRREKGRSKYRGYGIMSDIKKKVIEEIKKIYDPEIPVNIYELGLIYKIEVDDKNKIDIDMTLTSPNCPVAESLPKQVKDNIIKIEGVSDVNLNLVWEPPWDKDKMSEAAKLELNI